MSRRAVSLGLMAVLLLSACIGTGKLEELREITPKSSAFNNALARHYLKFAQAEADRYDWFSSRHFAEKGLAAANGQATAPEPVDEWNIPDYAIDELRSARATLASKLTRAYKQANPKKAATLQYSFDCWVEEQEEAWDIEAIESCKRDVYRHLEETDTPVQMGGPLSTSMLLYFPWDSNQVGGQALDELKDMARTAKHYNGRYELIINGHADRSGNSEYNLELSQKRADFIRQYLVRHGVPNARIKYFAFGESDPEVSTPDGVKEPANRRVEIFIE